MLASCFEGSFVLSQPSTTDGSSTRLSALAQKADEQYVSGRHSGGRHPGDRFFQAKQFSKALLWYQAALAKDSTDWYSTWRAAESLRHLFRYPEALAYYHRVYEYDLRHFPEAEFYYALMLKQQQQCAAALPLLDHFMRTQGNRHPLYDQAHIEQQGCYAEAFGTYDSSTLSAVRLPSPLNSAAHDYAAVPYRHDSSLILTSGRWGTSGRKIDYRTGQNYTNQVLVTKGEKAWKVKSRAIRRWNTRWHDGPGCFNADQTEYYFTRCEQDYCRIYLSRYQKGKWQTPTPLGEAVNMPDTNSKHPALSGGGDTLYFVSDRPNGYGGTDLWMSRRDSSDWAVSRNLGEAINTAFDEIAPSYYGSEDLFFFASQGHGTMGGMDIYGVPGFVHSRLRALPQQLPSPFNSPQDDCFLVMGKWQGFFSSNREENFDVYQFNPARYPTLAQQLFGRSFNPVATYAKTFINSSSDKVLNYDVPVSSQTSDIIVVRSVQEERLSNGSARFILNSDVNDIALRQLREQRDSARQPTSIAKGISEASTTFTYRPDSTSMASIQTDFIPPNLRGEVMGALYHENDGQSVPTSRTEVHLLDSAGEVVKITTTNEIGRFHFVNLAPDTRYSLALGEPSFSPPTAYHVRNLMVKEYGDEIVTVPYETLYFDFNQPTLRPEAQQALKDLVRYFRQNGQTAIEINAFTDSLGNDAYNMLLSQQRGESVFNFLLEQGVDRSALVINAQGVSTALSSTNSFVSQQLNRRVEIQLIGENVNYYPLAETRILRSNTDLSQLYQIEGMQENELRVLNGGKLDQVTRLKPLRVPVLESPMLDQFFFDIEYQP